MASETRKLKINIMWPFFYGFMFYCGYKGWCPWWIIVAFFLHQTKVVLEIPIGGKP